MKYLLIVLFLASCTAPGYVVQDARMEIKGTRVKIQYFGKPEKLADTVMTIKMIRRN